MVLSLLTRITNGVFIEFIDERKIVFAKDLTDYHGGRMTKTAMPTGRRYFVEGEGTLI
jgi:hypothetical protein